MVFANPLLDLFSNTDRHLAAVVRFALRNQAEVIVPADIPLFAQFIEGRNELFLRINGKLESLNSSVMFATASYDTVSCSAQRSRSGDSNRIVGQTQLHIGRQLPSNGSLIVVETPIRDC